MSSRPRDFVFTSPGPLRLYSTVELMRLPPPEWLIHDILPAGGLVGIYGQPGTMKSFVAIDMALAIGTGQAWQGTHATKKGLALYISAEGGVGIGKRVKAWLKHHHVKPEDANVAWLTESLPVTSTSEQLGILFKRLSELKTITDADWEPSLVVVDTLARCFDGDENQQEDMNAFIGGIDQMRHDLQATVIVVHHTRLGGDRERGNTAFRGAADTMISLTRNTTENRITLTCNKQKDALEFLERDLTFREVKDDIDALNDSGVVLPFETQFNREDTIVEIIENAGNIGIGLKYIKEALENAGPRIPSTSLKRQLLVLLKEGKIIRENGVYWRL